MTQITIYQARYYCISCGKEIMDWEEACANCGGSNWESQDVAYCASCGMNFVDDYAGNPQCPCSAE